MRNFESTKDIHFDHKLAKKSKDIIHKEKAPNAMGLQSQKTTQKIFNTLLLRSESGMTEKQTIKNEQIWRSQAYWAKEKGGKVREACKSEDHEKKQVERLKEEIDRLRRNHQQEIEFYLQEELRILVFIENLLTSKQYRRLLSYITNQKISIEERLEEHLTSNLGKPDQENILNQMNNSTLCLQSVIEEDPDLDFLTYHLESNIQEIGIDKIKILPPIKKLMNETDLSVKKLTWYFSKLPFDVPSKETCQNLASKLVGNLNCCSGNEVLDVILQKFKRRHSMRQDVSSSESSISKIIERQSLCNL